jgi:hypothetical protein
MEEPSVDEREWAMGFHIDVTFMSFCSKDPIGKFWGKSWTFIASHVFSIWHQ